MSNGNISTTQPPRPRWRWLRYFYQFSLRTLLVVTTLAAVACWWFLRPQVQEEELAGKHLTRRRQVRLEPGEASKPQYRSVGWWQLRGEEGDLLADGRYDNGQPHGKWTIWHANGRKAAEGDAFRGARTGVWRVWDDAGTLRSEVTYRAVPHVSALAPPVSHRPFVTTVIPVVAPFPTARGSSIHVADGYISQRHGPCRTWYASGRVELEGQYKDDQRDGLWTYYDEQGRIVERGTYRADLREGVWTTSDPRLARSSTTGDAARAPSSSDGRRRPSGDATAQITYISGRTQAEHEALLARLATDLASGNIRRQVAAAAMLQELGSAGVPLLAKLLAQESGEARLLAVRALARQEAIPENLLAQIEPLANDSDPRLALRAIEVLYRHQPQRRTELYARLVALLQTIDSRDARIEALRLVCDVDPERRTIAFVRMVEEIAKGWVPNSNWPSYVVTTGSPYPLDAANWDLVLLLEAAFKSPERNVRLFVLAVVETTIEHGPPKQTTGGAPPGPSVWDILPAFQPLIDKAKADPDPAVRQAAEGIGTQPGGMGGFF